MDISVKSLEQAISIRRQIDNLQRRLSSILGGGAPPTMTTTRPAAGRYFSPSTRAKLSAAARARWERLRGGATTATSARKKGQLTPAGRRKLSQRSEEHTSELQSQSNLVCRLLLEKKKNTYRKSLRPPCKNVGLTAPNPAARAVRRFLRTGRVRHGDGLEFAGPRGHRTYWLR